MPQSIRIATSLQTRAAVEPSTFDSERGTVEVVFTTGARGKRRSWDGDYYEELEVSEKAVDLSRLNNGAPVLNAHSSWDCRDVVGVVERAWLAGEQGRAVVRLSDREDVKPIRADVAAGILRHVSVGYSVQRMEKIEESEGIPVYRVTRWQPAEISLVPMGFDDRAVVRGADQQQFEEVELEEQAMPTANQNPTEGGTPIAAPAAPAVPAPVAAPPAVTDEQRAAIVHAERERVTAIRNLVTRARLDASVADDLVTKGVTVDAARAAVFEKLVAREAETEINTHLPIQVGDTAREKFLRGAVSGLLARSGMLQTVLNASKTAAGAGLDKGVDADPGEFRGMRLSDLARECLENAGVSTRRMGVERMIGEALTHRIGGMSATGDFPILLEVAMSKALLGGYAIQGDTWREFCAIKSVGDFRPANFYKVGSLGDLVTVDEHGEFKSMPIPDGERSQLQARPWGRMIAITRQALINDDLNSFMDLAQKLGRAAARTIENQVYAMVGLNAGLGPLLPDGLPLFDAGRLNISAGNPISVVGLDADRQTLAAQRDPAGNDFLDLQPSILLLPIGLKGVADVLNKSVYDPDAGAPLQRPNMVVGLFSKIVGTPRLVGTRRYVFADPSIAPVYAVAFLNGVQSPEIQTKDGWRVDGTEMKVRLDFGTGWLDWRGAVTDAGI